MLSLKIVVAVVGILAVASTSDAQLVDKKALTLGAAKHIAAAAEADAKAKGARVVIAVVDDGGNLLLLERLDDTQVASVTSASGRRGRQRSSGARAKCSKIRSGTGASPR